MDEDQVWIFSAEQESIFTKLSKYLLKNIFNNISFSFYCIVKITGPTASPSFNMLLPQIYFFSIRENEP